MPGMPACSKNTLKVYSFKVVLEVTHFSHYYIKTHPNLGNCTSDNHSIVMVAFMTNAMQFNLLLVFGMPDLGFHVEE